jgi:hypothetical protein
MLNRGRFPAALIGPARVALPNTVKPRRRAAARQDDRGIQEKVLRAVGWHRRWISRTMRIACVATSGPKSREESDSGGGRYRMLYLR